MKKIKYLTILFAILVTPSLSQAQIFDFWNNKAYKISIKGVENSTKANFISSQIEDKQLAVFSYIDPTSNAGYFIVNNFSKIKEIENEINNSSGYSFISANEVVFNKETFLEMYMKRSGFEKSQFSNNKPKEILMGENKDLTTNLYSKALEVWENYYSKAFDEKRNDLPEHYPVFVNTGNPENDSRMYEQAKQEWLKNYPEESQYSTGSPYQDDKAKKAKSAENK